MRWVEQPQSLHRAQQKNLSREQLRIASLRCKKRNGRSAGADRPFVLLPFQVSAYWTLNWALVPGVEPQSHRIKSAPFAVV